MSAFTSSHHADLCHVEQAVGHQAFVLLLMTSSLNGVFGRSSSGIPAVHPRRNLARKWSYRRRAPRRFHGVFNPSGHAMGASAFYSYLYAFVKNRYIRIAAVVDHQFLSCVAPLSRGALCRECPHRLGDRTLGCARCHQSFAAIGAWWDRLPMGSRSELRLQPAWRSGCSPLPSITAHRRPVAGGCILRRIPDRHRIARPLELRLVNFDPRSSPVLAKFHLISSLSACLQAVAVLW